MEPMNEEVQRQVADELGLYVYMLVDPRSGVPFYVGKGRGTRFAAHGWEAMLGADDMEETGEADESQVRAKIAKIREIRKAGGEPEIWIIRHGMKSGTEYTSVEGACIDLLQSLPIQIKTPDTARLPEGCSSQLTNARREASRGHGIMLLQDLYDEMAAPLLATDLPLLLVTLGPWTDNPNEEMPGGYLRHGYGYKSEWLTRSERIKHYQQIGESIAGWFKYTEAGVKNRGIEYAVAVHRGVTRALVKIDPDSWESDGSGRARRSAFAFEVVDSGPVFDQTVGTYGHRVPPKKRGTQTQFYYPYR